MVFKMQNIASVFGFGAIGAALRALIIGEFPSSPFPCATLVINISGSLVLGLLTGFFLKYMNKEWIRLGLGTGLCGGFTTMSTFAADTYGLISAGYLIQALLYTAGSVFLSILAAMAGLALSRWAA